MKNKTKILSLIIAAVMVLSLVSCSGGNEGSKETGKNENTKLSFKSAQSYADLKKLDGTAVTINGYMATSSPVDGSFIFLMNMPYQSCPFCKPNTSQLSNTMEVYPKDGDSFDYTTQAISVTGTLVVAENEESSFTDMYGYEFNFKIIDADYVIMKSEDLSEEFALFQQLTQTDIISEVYKMYDYVYFLCAWDGYCVESYEDENGETQPGYYLYASDALNYIQKDGAQYNYGYQNGYFENIIKTIEKVDKTAFADLTDNIKSAEALAEKALSALESGEYTYELKTTEKFGTEDYVYTINDKEAFVSEFDTYYNFFVEWLGNWEM